jgi:hypothetical protein
MPFCELIILCSILWPLLKLGVKQKEKINFVAEGIEDKKKYFYFV